MLRKVQRSIFELSAYKLYKICILDWDCKIQDLSFYVVFFHRIWFIFMVVLIKYLGCTLRYVWIRARGSCFKSQHWSIVSKQGSGNTENEIENPEKWIFNESPSQFIIVQDIMLKKALFLRKKNEFTKDLVLHRTI